MCDMMCDNKLPEKKEQRWNGTGELTMSAMRDAVKLQEDYNSLVVSKRLTKKAMCELCIPFRDRYRLKDSQTLRIARAEMPLSEMTELLEAKYASTQG